MLTETEKMILNLHESFRPLAQYTAADGVAKPVLHQLRRKIQSRDARLFMSMHKAMALPYLGYASQSWALNFVGHKLIPQSVQWRLTSWVTVLLG